MLGLPVPKKDGDSKNDNKKSDEKGKIEVMTTIKTYVRKRSS